MRVILSPALKLKNLPTPSRLHRALAAFTLSVALVAAFAPSCFGAESAPLAKPPTKADKKPAAKPKPKAEVKPAQPKDPQAEAAHKAFQKFAVPFA